MMLVRKRSFKFDIKPYKSTAKLCLKKTYTNVFITLTDLENKVIICLSAGFCEKRTSSKRRKTSPQIIEVIMEQMYKYITTYKITNLIIVLKSKSRVFLRFLVKELLYYNLKVLGFSFRRKVAYIPMRGRKIRRK